MPEAQPDSISDPDADPELAGERTHLAQSREALQRMHDHTARTFDGRGQAHGGDHVST